MPLIEEKLGMGWPLTRIEKTTEQMHLIMREVRLTRKFMASIVDSRKFNLTL